MCVLALRNDLLLASAYDCVDEPLWKDSTYGVGCDFYATSDPGCKKFLDLGQIANCNSTCGNCDGLRVQEADPLDTTCSITDLCSCFEGCSTTTLCPASDEAQACIIESVTAASSLPPAAGQPWLELRLASVEQVVGVEVRGSTTRYAKTITATSAEATGSAIFANIDGGRSLPANWEGGHAARVLFEQGPVKAQVLRLQPQSTTPASALSKLSELSARVIVERCRINLGPQTSQEKCDDLKCRAYCYRTLSCEGAWVSYCEQQRETQQSCDVRCSYAAASSLPWCLIVTMWALLIPLSLRAK